MVAHGVLAVEMEASALYTLAASYGRKALAICTVSDHIVTGEETTSRSGSRPSARWSTSRSRPRGRLPGRQRALVRGRERREYRCRWVGTRDASMRDISGRR